MKTLLMLIVAAACMSAETGKTTPAKRRAVARRPAAEAVTIPADAKKVNDYTWSHTGANGVTTWYRRTPFGIMRSTTAPDSVPEKPEQTASRERGNPFSKETESSVASENVKVSIAGETVTFERGTPFGKSRWSRPMSELTDDERRWLEQSKGQGN